MAVSDAETPSSNGYEFAQGSGYVLPEYPFVEPAEIRRGEVSHHPIVIVGGGLAGLTMACSLARYGVPAVLLDEDNTVGVKGASSRGICYTQKSLEIFERLGVYDRIAAKGVQWSRAAPLPETTRFTHSTCANKAPTTSAASLPSSTSSSSTSKPTWSSG
jgi:3-(3-hydroxy-phenyl)propionate hydroxylase